MLSRMKGLILKEVLRPADILLQLYLRVLQVNLPLDIVSRDTFRFYLELRTEQEIVTTSIYSAAPLDLARLDTLFPEPRLQYDVLMQQSLGLLCTLAFPLSAPTRILNVTMKCCLGGEAFHTCAHEQLVMSVNTKTDEGQSIRMDLPFIETSALARGSCQIALEFKPLHSTVKCNPITSLSP